MALKVITPLFGFRPRVDDWTQQELAEFYRVQDALLQGGMPLETDRGLTDEGDPWFVFCRADSGDPVAHFARIGREYIVVSPAFEGISRGRDFRALVQNLLARHRLTAGIGKPSSNVFLHPAALLVALIGTAFFKSSEARAEDTGDAPNGAEATKRHGHTAAGASSLNPVGGDAAFDRDIMSLNLTREIALVATAAVSVVARDAEAAVPHPNDAPVAGSSAVDLMLFHQMATSHAVLLDASTQERVLETFVAISAVLNDLPPGDSRYEIVLPTSRSEGAHSDDPNNSHELSSATPASLIVAATHEELPVVLAIRTGSEQPVVHSTEVHQSAALPAIIANLISRGTVLTESGKAEDVISLVQQTIDLHLTQNNGPELPTGATEHFQPTLFPDTKASPATEIISGDIRSHLSTDEIAELVRLYLAENPSIRMLVDDNNFVFVPTDILDHPGQSATDSLTLSFENGSSISLVGQTASIHHLIDVMVA